jgi:formylglycine-generating enzyme required for sulfatase activity
MNIDKRLNCFSGLCALAICAALFVAGPAFGWSPGERIGMDLDWLRVENLHEHGVPEPDIPAGTTWVEPVTGMEMVWVPGGCFLQGTPPSEDGRYEDEGPVHEVCLNGFWIGRFPVTNAQFRKFAPNHDSKEYNGLNLNGDTQPVVNVSWYEAMDFSRWLSERSQGRYTFWLPTESEWEYACRAGTSTSRYWGDEPDMACQYANVADISAQEIWPTWPIHDCDDGHAVTSPVGAFNPNAWGIYDILGNVWEMCQDWRGPYSSEPGPYYNPTGPSSSKQGRIVRGGSWDNNPNGVRCGNRSYATPNFKRYNNGFRIVRIR